MLSLPAPVFVSSSCARRSGCIQASKRSVVDSDDNHDASNKIERLMGVLLVAKVNKRL